jgi:hypothetical protein
VKIIYFFSFKPPSQPLQPLRIGLEEVGELTIGLKGCATSFC